MAILLTAIAGCGSPSVNITEPPIRMQSETTGTGRAARPGDIATIDYSVHLPNGETVLDQRGYRFAVGAGAVISAVDEAVNGMRVGGRRVFECPPHRHWGRQGYGDGIIPPNTLLTIDLTLKKVE